MALKFYSRNGTEMTRLEWAKAFEDLDYKRVARTKIPGQRKYVSTVWLGTDYRFYGKGEPIIFETMVFSSRTSYNKPWSFDRMSSPGYHYNKAFDDYTRRYSTLDQAQIGHEAVVREVEARKYG